MWSTKCCAVRHPTRHKPRRAGNTQGHQQLCANSTQFGGRALRHQSEQAAPSAPAAFAWRAAAYPSHSQRQGAAGIRTRRGAALSFTACCRQGQRERNGTVNYQPSPSWALRFLRPCQDSQDRVAHQQTREPPVISTTPCQNGRPGCTDSHTLANKADSTGVKYEPAAITARLPR